ncbi:hemin uptake protein HemP [Mesorhizobium sp. M1322]|uniref:hemin uptake protein HemP n=1 Tax=Mesorhizobium sp. M1322 TaxID=2957081 RepID=UPI0033381221
MGFHRHVPARVTRVSPLRQHPRFSRGCDDVRTLSSDTLFTGQQQIRVEHYGTPYRLKIPRQGS